MRSWHSALRELGAITLARIRAWFVDRVRTGEHIPFVARIANGESIAGSRARAADLRPVTTREAQLTQALELFEKVGDRRGAMSAIVSLAYLHWGPELHLGTNPAQRFEGIRQLATAMATLVQGSGREAAEGQMLYGAHVFARAKVIPDMALERGQQAYDHARSLGDSDLEFLSAIGTGPRVSRARATSMRRSVGSTVQQIARRPCRRPIARARSRSLAP